MPYLPSHPSLGVEGGEERNWCGAYLSPVPRLGGILRKVLDRGAEPKALVPALPLVFCVTLGKCFNLSGLSFLVYKMRRLHVMILKLSLCWPSQI